MASPATTASVLRIVVVEQDPAQRRFLREALESQCGHQVVGEAATGSDMVRVVLNLEPDVVVFDVHLPGVNGLDALRQVSGQYAVAAMALAEKSDRAVVRQALEEYNLTYLVKPVEAHQLEPAVLAARARFDKERQLADENAALREKLQNRKLIERAKGVLMRRYRWSEDEGHRRLQRAAMNQRTTVAQLAQDVLNGAHVRL